jgi:hypothetical protein
VVRIKECVSLKRKCMDMKRKKCGSTESITANGEKNDERRYRDKMEINLRVELREGKEKYTKRDKHN